MAQEARCQIAVAVFAVQCSLESDVDPLVTVWIGHSAAERVCIAAQTFKVIWKCRLQALPFTPIGSERSSSDHHISTSLVKCKCRTRQAEVGLCGALANIAQYADQVAEKSLRRSPSCWIVEHWKPADMRVSLEVGPIK